MYNEDWRMFSDPVGETIGFLNPGIVSELQHVQTIYYMSVCNLKILVDDPGAFLYLASLGAG